MGYYTRHKLTIISGDDFKTDYRKEIGEESDYGDPFGDECKWYNHEKDMRAYSKKHPKVLFELSGEGEEAGDLWKEYYLNGKMQRAKAVLTYDTFDIKKLT